MRFLFPELLWWWLLALVPLALYLVRRRATRVAVPTLTFFKSLAQEHQESAWLRRLKKWISFFLTILMLTLVVFALAQLVPERQSVGGIKSVVILLDRSASMGVTDSSGKTRLVEAKNFLRERLATLPEGIGVSLVAFDVRPEVVQPRTFQHRELLAKLDDIEVRPMPGDAEAAFASAKLIAGVESPAQVWLASDDVERATSLAGASGLQVEAIPVALPEVVNPAITAFRIRPAPLEYGRYDIFVQVALNAAAPAETEATLELTIGGLARQVRSLALKPGEKIGLDFPVNGTRSQLLALNLKADKDDLLTDNHIVVPLPELRPIIAAWIRPDESEDPYTRLALVSIQEAGNFQLLKGGPGAWPLRDPVDVVLFDGWLPEVLPRNVSMILLNPPDSAGEFGVRRLPAPIPHDEVTVALPEHPLLFRVSSGRVAVMQTASFSGSGPLERLWYAGQDGILAAGEFEGQRVVAMGFAPGLSERLPLTSSFPLLMGNALYWCADSVRSEGQMPLRTTGELIAIGTEAYTWHYMEEGAWRSQRVDPSNKIVELDRVGWWESESGKMGAAHMLSAVESDIPIAAAVLRNESPRLSHWSWLTRPTVALLSVLLVVLVLDSWLFHRWSVY
jgi:hypothetical protein